MRLLYCTSCSDTFRLVKSVVGRRCSCGQSSGHLDRSEAAVVGGEGVVLGINQSSLNKAIAGRPVAGNGPSFYAFVMPRGEQRAV